MNSYFSLSDKVYDITEKYPEIIDVLAANGFENLRNEMMRKTIGRTISLEMALRSKRLDTALFEKQLVEAIEQKNPALETGLKEAKSENGGDVKIKGVLPCPVRMPLMESLEKWFKAQETTYDYSLQAASMGLDWVADEIKNNPDKGEEILADVYVSAGYELFFDRKLMGKYRESGVFADIINAPKLNPCFDNENIDLKDPLHRYSIIGAVPAVLVVNQSALGERKMPTGWEDILSPEFEKSIAVPVRDLDMFNALLLGIYTRFGEDGVRRFGKSLVAGMHPAEMVKNGTRKTAGGPAVTVMPYFFTWMIRESKDMVMVWPKEGAIISPIFVVSKASAKEKAKPFADFLFSREVGEVFTTGGKFPSTHPDVDNQLEKEQGFLWAGWDLLNKEDIGALLVHLETIFHEAGGKTE